MPFWKKSKKNVKPDIQVSVYASGDTLYNNNNNQHYNNNNNGHLSVSPSHSNSSRSPSPRTSLSKTISNTSNSSSSHAQHGSSSSPYSSSTNTSPNQRTRKSFDSTYGGSPKNSIVPSKLDSNFGFGTPNAKTLQVPGSGRSSRGGSFDWDGTSSTNAAAVVDNNVDSGTGSLLISEDESYTILQNLHSSSSPRHSSSSSIGSGSSSIKSTKSNKSTNRKPFGSNQSINQLSPSSHGQVSRRGSSLSPSPTTLLSYSDNLKYGKELFESKWADTLEAEQNPTSTTTTTTMSDFHKHKTIGDGCYGDILLVQHKSTRVFHAMKISNKQLAKKKNQIEQLNYERRIMSSISFPFVTTLQYYFEDPANTYTIMEFIPGGDMFYHLRAQKKFPEAQVRFYAAQLVLTLEYLHNVGLVFRDLKPENILVDVDGYLKLTDFGLSKRIDGGRRWTFCGTPEYIAPEIILCKGYSKAVDWWSLGILLYEMSAGHPPFQGDTPLDIYERIVSSSKPIPYPTKTFSPELKDLIKNLLQLDLTRRYGNLRNGVNDIKYHKWLLNVDWEAIYNKTVVAPMLPNVKHPGDSHNFSC